VGATLNIRKAAAEIALNAGVMIYSPPKDEARPLALADRRSLELAIQAKTSGQRFRRRCACGRIKREIANAISDPDIKRITFVKPGTVWVPFKMIQQKIPGLSAWTLDELGARMKCDKCGKRPERYYPARQSDAPGFAKSY
jgi:hypothetical protein